MALVLPNLELGGAERQAVELALALPACGWEPVLLVAELHGPLLVTVRGAGIACEDLGAELWRGKWTPGFWMNLAGVLRRIRGACLRHNVSVVQSFLFWQNQLAVPAGVFTPGVRAIITGRRDIATYKRGRPHYQVIENVNNLFTDAIVCNSRMVARDVRRREHVPRGRLRVIPNGVDVARFARAGMAARASVYPAIRDSSFVVGTVGNLKAQKRHDVFLRAVAIARGRVAGIEAVIIGRDMGEEARLKRLAGELGVGEHVFFTGEVADPAPFYGILDAFVLTSDQEGMPNVVLEAMAAGRAIVATDVGGVRELIRDGQHGFIVPCGDAEAIAERLVASAQDADLRKRLGAAARARVERRFSTRAMAVAYARLYEELTGGRRA